MLVNMKEMLKDAELHNYAIGSLKKKIFPCMNQ